MNMPGHIYNFSVPLYIDSAIRRLDAARGNSIGLHRRWGLVNAIYFGRRSLEVAILSANDASEAEHTGEIIKEWEVLGNQARRASIELHALLKLMAAKGAYPAKGADSLFPLLSRFYTRTSGARTAVECGKVTAQILAAADTFVREYETFAEDVVGELKAGRSYAGRPAKAAFVYTMAESWIHLTGRIPGSQGERNPFLQFAEDAWRDTGEARENFAWHLRDVVQQLDKTAPETFTPRWI